jgi:hypothetical protein
VMLALTVRPSVEVAPHGQFLLRPCDYGEATVQAGAAEMGVVPSRQVFAEVVAFFADGDELPGAQISGRAGGHWNETVSHVG